jgi:hypothetical protein
MTTGQAEGFRQRRAISLPTARQAIADHDGGGPRRRIEDSGRDIISMSVEKPGFAITPGYRELPTQVVVKGDGTKERFQRIHGPTDTGMAC